MDDRPRPSLFHETLLLSHRDPLSLPTEVRELLCSDPAKLNGLLRRLNQYAALPRPVSMCSPHLLPLGIFEIDRLLGGGAMQGHVVEVFGPTASGKTQLAHCAAAMTAARPREGVIYVDSNGSFNVKRLGHVLGRVRTDEEEDWRLHLDKVQVVRTRDVRSVVSSIKAIMGRSSDAYDRITMVVVDSIGTILAPLIGGYASSVGHQTMFSLCTFLKQVARVQSCAVIVTNHTVSSYVNTSKNNIGSDNGPAATFHALGLEQAGFVLRRAALGEAWPGHANIRLQLVMKNDTAGGGVPGVPGVDAGGDHEQSDVVDRGNMDDETSQMQLSRSHVEATGVVYPAIPRAAVVVQSSVGFVAPVGSWSEFEL